MKFKNKLKNRLILAFPFAMASVFVVSSCAGGLELNPISREQRLTNQNGSVVDDITSTIFNRKSEGEINSFKNAQLKNTEWIQDYKQLSQQRKVTTDLNQKREITDKMRKYVRDNWYFVLKNQNLIKWQFSDTYLFPENPLQKFSEGYLKRQDEIKKDQKILSWSFQSKLKEPSAANLLADRETSRGNYFLELDDHFFFYFSYKQNSRSDDVVLEPWLFRFEKNQDVSFRLLTESWHNVLLHPKSEAYVKGGTRDFETLSSRYGHLLLFEIIDIQLPK
ncbi:aromatic motif membrane protein [[Mycoplasma] testudinis]|uniref:aromatic motif membrane protein n=1 Tax=[Mycoplasma] testudinis TaxID=33924 RepID=UPI00048371B7|nr:aromatic motif membrane protein [[Mycoplasma] testudinis]